MLNTARHQPAAPWAEAPINFPKRDTTTPVDFLSFNSSVLRQLEAKVAASGARERGRERERVLETTTKINSTPPLPSTAQRNTTTPDFLLVLRQLEAKATGLQTPERSLSHKTHTTHTTHKTASPGGLPLPRPLQKSGDGEGGCCSAVSGAAAAATTVGGGGGGVGGGVACSSGVETGNVQQDLEPAFDTANSAGDTGYDSGGAATQALGTGRSRGAEAYSAGGCLVPGLRPHKMCCYCVANTLLMLSVWWQVLGCLKLAAAFTCPATFQRK